MIFFARWLRCIGSTLNGETPLWPDLTSNTTEQRQVFYLASVFELTSVERGSCSISVLLEGCIPLLVTLLSTTNSTIPSIDLATNTCHDIRRNVKARQWKQEDQEESLHKRWNKGKVSFQFSVGAFTWHIRGELPWVTRTHSVSSLFLLNQAPLSSPTTQALPEWLTGPVLYPSKTRAPFGGYTKTRTSIVTLCSWFRHVTWRARK